jgi:hypothetical protein
VKPGAYKLKTWQRSQRYREQELAVKADAGKATELTVEMSRGIALFGGGLLVLMLLSGCHSGAGTGGRASGPGVQVEVRAEPKRGYNPPAPGDVGYGLAPDSLAASGHDHAFHLIDYRKLGGIVVWVEPTAYTGASGMPADAKPIDATVALSGTKPAGFEDVHVASVGGRITFKLPPSGAGYFLRTSEGDVADLPAAGQAYTPDKPGVIEVLPESAADDDPPTALICVTPTPWARKARAGERVTFAPLPPGGYVARAWHARLPGMSQSVNVAPDGKQLAKVSLTVGVNSLPKPAK